MRRAIEVSRAVTFLAHPRSTRYHPGRKKPMTPEQKARGEIDRQLSACGWVVQDVGHANIHAARGVAANDFPLQTHEY